MDTSNSSTQYHDAVSAIKTAILNGQYEAAKGVNRIQLALYFAVGKFLSSHTRKDVWGEGALAAISEQLHIEMPGLRGFSATQLKEMRLFYEAWQMLDARRVGVQGEHTTEKSTVATVELSQNDFEKKQIVSTSALKTDFEWHWVENELVEGYNEQSLNNSSDMSDELSQKYLSKQESDLHDSVVAAAKNDDVENEIDIFHAISVTNVADLPVEDFFSVPFSHHIAIFGKVKDIHARYYYLTRTAQERLSVRTLRKLIKEDAHLHQGAMACNFAQTIKDPRLARRAVEMFKDEYLLDFINVEEIGTRDRMDVDERVVEQQIVHNIKEFIMTFGRDFAFIGNQYHLEVYGVEQFPDLLFFNRELNAMVVVELKMGEFKTSYLGQLFGYLQILDDHVRKPHENPTVGIVLCQQANKAYAEYAVRDYTKPMGVATYKTLDDMPEKLRRALPDLTKMTELLNKK